MRKFTQNVRLIRSPYIAGVSETGLECHAKIEETKHMQVLHLVITLIDTTISIFASL